MALADFCGMFYLESVCTETLSCETITPMIFKKECCRLYGSVHVLILTIRATIKIIMILSFEANPLRRVLIFIHLDDFNTVNALNSVAVAKLNLLTKNPRLKEWS